MTEIKHVVFRLEYLQETASCKNESTTWGRKEKVDCLYQSIQDGKVSGCLL